MRKKRVSLFCFSSGALFVGAAITLGVLLKHEPNFYRVGGIEAGEQRKQLSIQFVGKFVQLVSNLKFDRDDWQFKFTEVEINSFFQEDFVNYGEAENLRKAGVSDPRISFEDTRIRLAFRYGSGFWSTVVSYDLRIWVVPKETNVIAIEILSRRAGGLPLSSQALLADIAELGSRHNIDMTPYRHDGHPVALLRFQADQSRATPLLRCIGVQRGSPTAPAALVIAGSNSVCPLRGNEPAR